MKIKLSWFLFVITGALATGSPAAEKAAATPHTFAIGTNDFLLDGKKFQIRCGEIHAARVPMEYWRHRLQLAKAMGLNTVCAYLFWNLHEPKPGEYVWTGQADDAEFCRIAQEEGWQLPQAWHDFSQHGYGLLPLPTRTLPAVEVLRFRDRAFQRYFEHPPFLDMIEQKFDSPVRDHLVQMNATRLKRKLLGD